MTAKTSGDGNTAAALLQRLCCKITGLCDDAVIPHYQFALRILGSNYSTAQGDEFQVAEKIKRQLVRRGREEDAATFSELHRKLLSQGIIKNKWAILQLLHSLTGTGQTASRSLTLGSTLFSQGLPSHATSTPHAPFSGLSNRLSHEPGHSASEIELGAATTLGTIHHSSQFTSSSGISSIHGEGLSDGPTPVPQSFLPR